MKQTRRKPKCSKGGSCGNACISQSDTCRDSLSAETGSFLDKVSAKIKSLAPSKETLAHEGEHLARNVASWKMGKVLGPAIAQVAVANGIDASVAQLLSETAVQATAATIMSMRERKNRTVAKVAGTMMTETSAALLGKLSHGGTESLAEQFIANERAVAISALVAGKAAGITTAITSARSGIEGQVGRAAQALYDGVTGGSKAQEKPEFAAAIVDFTIAAELTRRRAQRR